MRRCAAHEARAGLWLDRETPAILLFQCIDCGHVDMIEVAEPRRPIVWARTPARAQGPRWWPRTSRSAHAAGRTRQLQQVEDVEERAGLVAPVAEQLKGSPAFLIATHHLTMMSSRTSQ